MNSVPNNTLAIDHEAPASGDHADISRAAALLDEAIVLCEKPGDMTVDSLRKMVWRPIYQARDLLRDEPIGIWPSAPPSQEAQS